MTSECHARKSVTRDELYALVWDEPMETVAVRYGLSGRGLAKICERMKVPRPGRGYWQKRRHGHRVRRPPLRHYDGPQCVRLGGHSGEALEVTGPVAEQEEHESRAENLITVPDRVGRYHPLLRRADLRVDKKSIQRARRIMDALLKALEARGLFVQVERDSGKTSVRVQGTEEVRPESWTELTP